MIFFQLNKTDGFATGSDSMFADLIQSSLKKGAHARVDLEACTVIPSSPPSKVATANMTQLNGVSQGI